MNTINLKQVENFVNENIVYFHENRIKVLDKYTLRGLTAKNPYLQRAKNIVKAQDLVEGALNAKLSSSEEKIFGDFFEELTIFVAQQTAGGTKSSAPGIDLEFKKEDIHYLVSIKSGENWGNSSQWGKLEQDFQKATARLKQQKKSINVQSILGICYGKSKPSFVRGFQKLAGQSFWYFISGNKDLYIDIIEPLGFEAKKHNEKYNQLKDQKINLLTNQFIQEYCYPDGSINWKKLVEINCGNLE